jgi:RNA polymerase sigma-70 factor (ECF subfamily)
LSSIRKLVTTSDQASRAASGVWQGGWPQSLEEFERFVEFFQDRLVRYAFRRLGNLHEAEEAAQETFVRAYAAGSSDRKITNAGAYLYRMASNLCSDLLRKRKRSATSLDRIESSEMPAGQPSSTEAAAAEELRRIEQVLARIPRRQAEVIRLRVLDGLRLVEIAEVLDCPLGSVKSRLRYGLCKLRRIISREWEVRS